MKKLQQRAIFCLFLAAILLVGLGIYVTKWLLHGSQWAGYPANNHIYHQGYLSTGSIYDRNGVLLLQNNPGAFPSYHEEVGIRQSTLHAVGDPQGNISTAANQAFAAKLVGYNPITGVYSTGHQGRNLYLTIDASLCRIANEALAQREGTVGLYNYQTGEILCMVSTPNYDPANSVPPSLETDSGVYVNKLISSKVVPGSIFKTVTAVAALETIEDIDSWEYTCTGSLDLGQSEESMALGVDQVTCLSAHGTVDLEGALAHSCNCAFADLTLKIKKKNLEKYVDRSGLTHSYSINGIPTEKSSFDFSKEAILLAWTGVGQHEDLINPAAMMVYMGAIANGGTAASPILLDRITLTNGFPASLPPITRKVDLIEEPSANTLDTMMKNNVVESYGSGNFPGLNLGAKTGTAEIATGETPHSWFCGYLDDSDHPYAFIVLVENGGFGHVAAAQIANQVLQEAITLPAE